MNRGQLLVAIGRTDSSPTDAMWDELEEAPNRIRADLRLGYPITDRELLALGPSMDAIFEWKRRNELLPDDRERV